MTGYTKRFSLESLHACKWMPRAWRWSSAGLASFAVFTVILMTGTHVMLRWLRRSRDPAAPPWPWRWTIRLSAMVLLVFAAGVSVVGVVHQTAWIFREGILRAEMPRYGRSFIHQLNEKCAKQPMTAAQAGAWLQAQLPRWRIVVLPVGDQIGAIVLTEELSDKPSEVIVAWPSTDKRLSVTVLRQTTVSAQVADCAETLALNGFK